MTVRLALLDPTRRWVFARGRLAAGESALTGRWIALHGSAPHWAPLLAGSLRLIDVSPVARTGLLEWSGRPGGTVQWRGRRFYSLIDITVHGSSDRKRRLVVAALVNAAVCGREEDVMPSVRQSIEVSAPAERLFAMLADPKRATTFVPGLSRVTNVSAGDSSVGTTWDFEFDWFGLIIAGTSQCTEFERPHRYQFKTISGNLSTWTYHMEPMGDTCRLTLDVDYELPQSMLVRFASRSVLEQQNQTRANEIVENLKALAEE